MPLSQLSHIQLPSPQYGILLRFWDDKDALCVQSASRDEYIPSVTSIPPGCNIEQAEDWIHRQLRKITAGTDLPLCISSVESGEPLGMIGVFGLNKSVSHGGYWVAPEKRGKNYSGKALEIISLWALNVLGLQTLELFIEPDNVGSIKAAQFAGFSFDRTQTSETEIAGSFRTMNVFSVKRSEK